MKTSILEPLDCSNSKKRTSGQAPAHGSNPTTGRSPQGQPVLLAPKPWQPLPPMRSCFCSPQLQAQHGGQQQSQQGREEGQESKDFPSSCSTPQEPFMQPAYTGTFAQHPISVYLIIFLNMLEEETPWKKAVWNLSVKRKLCCFSKTHSWFNCLKNAWFYYIDYTRMILSQSWAQDDRWCAWAMTPKGDHLHISLGSH